MEEVILVDFADLQIGTMEKLQAHKEGRLHRAFSIFLFNERGEMLLQQRAFEKYHSGGLWSNTCCSHPRPNEEILDAAHRRLKEEMGIDCPLKKTFSFTYRAELDHGLIEYELDHVFIGKYDGPIFPNEEEVFAARWALPWTLLDEIAVEPEKFTYWFKRLLTDFEFFAFLVQKNQKID